MRKLMAVVVVLSVGACASRTSQRVGYGVGGSIAALGVVVAGSALSTQCSNDLEGLGCGIGKGLGTSMGISTVLLGAAILGVAAASNPPPDEPEPVLPREAMPVIPEPPTTHPQLARLTKQASVMARRDQCEGVVSVAREVALIDASYRTQGFVADASIAHCLPE